jgi:hypothetical protein
MRIINRGPGFSAEMTSSFCKDIFDTIQIFGVIPTKKNENTLIQT